MDSVSEFITTVSAPDVGSSRDGGDGGDSADYLLLARYLCELGKVMSIVHREISTYVIQRADFADKHAQKSAGWAVPLDQFCSEASHTSLFHLIKPLIFIFSSATR